MNCKDTTEILDRMIFEEVLIDADLRQHIDTCSNCSQVYNDALKAREVMVRIRLWEPVLQDPEKITDNIMSAIGQGSQKTDVIPLFLRRMLAAASVVIFLLFGYEQYGVVKKVSELEMQFSQIKADSCYSDPLRMTSTLDINNAGISLSEIESLLSRDKKTTLLSFSYINKRLNQRTIK